VLRFALPFETPFSVYRGALEGWKVDFWSGDHTHTHTHTHTRSEPRTISSAQTVTMLFHSSVQ